jgi:hypothetical protein
MQTRHAVSSCRTSCDARAPVDRPCDAEAKTRVAYRYSFRTLRRGPAGQLEQEWPATV